MKAEIVAVGSELLRFGRPDTNADWLCGKLRDLGVEVAQRAMTEDEAGRIARAVRGGLEAGAVVVVTGGLGPTRDDRTREALALALGEPLERDADLERRLREAFAARGYPFSEAQARQADRPRGTEWIENPIGSAFGIHAPRPGGGLFALPGVPAEMKAMCEAFVLPRLAAVSGSRIAVAHLRVGGRAESAVDAELRELYDRPGVDLTVLGGGGLVEVLIRATDAEGRTAAAVLAEAEAWVRRRLGEDVIGDGGQTPAAVVGALLRRRGWTLAVAESCTAGGLAAAVTEVPGSSAWFRGGLIVYDDGLKSSLAGVDPELIAAHGAVSEPVALALARGAAARCGAEVGVGVTGIAGPGGGTAEKPVGTVHLALRDPAGERAWALRLPGDRALVRGRTVSVALDRLRRRLLRERTGDGA